MVEIASRERLKISPGTIHLPEDSFFLCQKILYIKEKEQ